MEIAPEQDEGDTSQAALGDDAFTTAKSESSHPMDRSDERDEARVLAALDAHVQDQDTLERDINRQADELLTEQANERDTKRLDKAEAEKRRVLTQIRRINERASNERLGPATSRRLTVELSKLESEVQALEADIKDITTRIDERKGALGKGPEQTDGNQKLPNETRREFLIRTGKITPFSQGASNRLTTHSENLQDALLHAEQDIESGIESEEEDQTQQIEFRSHRNLRKPGFDDSYDVEHEELSPRPSKRRRVHRAGAMFSDEDGSSHLANGSAKATSPEIEDAASLESSESDGEYSEPSAATPSERQSDPESDLQDDVRKAAQKEQEDLRKIDDGNEKVYQKRLRDWIQRRSAARKRSGINEAEVDLEHEESYEWNMPHPTEKDHSFEGGFRIPGDIFPALFDYQKTGVQWLWELYSQNVGGIVGDEMGLGKTIQAIAFLAGLHYSRKLSKPVIIVAPATVMKQWVNEFHTWWPPFRVSILHSSGSGMMDIGRESRREEELLERRPGASSLGSSRQAKTAAKIVDRVFREGHVLVTTYSGLQIYSDILIPVDWEYAVLDEGHKIRNPNTSITLHCKELRTPNRIILSGTPMQNNLMELWSLFDFIFPMRLGNLVEFRNQFEIPIRIGGYANASNLQVQTAGKCAEVLKDAISPYLLQRNKIDVAADLPKKTERVLFCKLTKPQRDAYESFLRGDDMKSIMKGRRQVLYGVDILRKICNHPDLADHRTLSTKSDYNYGSGSKSGKMVVVKELLEVWKRAGHKTLLFSQSRIMLDILEKYIRSMGGINYRRMDGTTPISARQTMVDDFNRNPDAHVFLLTTKVGGLGVNLTGADRVIIFDPDWNPSTDIQARERAWRLGQKREVEIYRLMVAGTIEEKIFHRQIFKQFLTNKILKDPKQRQTFHMQDLHDLFTLGNSDDGETETGKLFAGTETTFHEQTNSTDQGNEHSHDISDPLRVDVDKAEANISGLDGIAAIRPFATEEEMPGATDHDDEISSPSGVDASLSAAEKRNSENRIMSALFARSGVTSAVEHDRIVNGRRIVAADPQEIRREAERAAASAAAELKRAEAAARATPAGTVTWTGEFGTGGRPGTSTNGAGLPARYGGRARGGGPSSSSVLAGLQARQENEATDGNDSSSSAAAGRASTPSKRGKAGVDFVRQIRDYITAHGGRVYTQMLVNHFNWQCTTPRRTEEFQAMLKTIAVLEKGRGGRGSWVLKDEYKNQ